MIIELDLKEVVEITLTELECCKQLYEVGLWIAGKDVYPLL
ncbi:hypothetical protein RR42_m1447 [Cupriavidus basilensis]|uniref:Uncharacterized protein n=1 Tax=Cupriavidus basilensis TaxID=68895 RepID=A0A0C4Y7D4_9BURK|nr:hypothetical protein RR42_m1447 [Cupriavidus basilensis]